MAQQGQTTAKREPRKEQTTSQIELLRSEIRDLHNQVKGLERLCHAKDRRIRFLEMILRQRNETTRRSYEKLKALLISHAVML
jgi:hypothetical protein